MVRRAVLTGLLALLAGCFTPPIVERAGAARIDLDLFPPGTDLVDLPVGSHGERLRGVWIPGDSAEAPVVLHFLPTQTAVSSGLGRRPRHQVVWDLRDRGLASLIVDYRGVGASDGNPDGGQLREDARAIWEEGLRRAGDSRRVVLRGNSLGTLAIASLLQDGADPAAVVMAAPILDDTVTYNVAKERIGTILAWLADVLVYRDPVGVDLVRELANSKARRLVMVGDEDEYIGADGRARLIPAVQRSGGSVVVEREFSHIDAGIEGHYPLAGEGELYAALFPDTVRIFTRTPSGSPAAIEAIAGRWRLDPPRAAIPLARLSAHVDDAGVARVVAWYRDLPATKPTDDEGLAALLDFDDPAGALDLSELDTLAPYASATMPHGDVVSVEELPELAASQRLHRRKLLSESAGQRGFGRVLPTFRSIDLDRPHAAGDLPPRLRLSPRESLRQVVRILLKSRGVPERVSRAPDGTHNIEWRDPSGRWQALPLPAADP